MEFNKTVTFQANPFSYGAIYVPYLLAAGNTPRQRSISPVHRNTRLTQKSAKKHAYAWFW
jgi:hypothetical protein